jgi:hypothetical protein
MDCVLIVNTIESIEAAISCCGDIFEFANQPLVVCIDY